MDYRIAVCDDEPQARELAQACAVQWAHKHGYSVEVRQFPTGDAFLFQYEEDKAWDILLLDVEMPGRSGVELAKAVRQQNKRTQIVFITGYADYIAEGYDVSALHYLLKPLDREKLFSVLGRAAERLHQRRQGPCCWSCPRNWCACPLYEVEYLEVRGNYVTVHTGREAYTVKKALSALERETRRAVFPGGAFLCGEPWQGAAGYKKRSDLGKRQRCAPAPGRL